MKMTDFIEDAALLSNQPVGGYVEIFRHMREGSRKLVDYERKLARTAGNRGFDWGDDYSTLLAGKSGPGNGLDVTPGRAAYFLVGTLLDCDRRDVGRVALDVMFARHVPVVTPHTRGLRLAEGDVCGVTGHHTFGGALIEVMKDPELMGRLEQISVCGDLGLGMLVFDDGEGHFSGGHFLTDSKTFERSIGRYTLVNSYGIVLREVITGMSPAKRRRLTGIK
jgi:hypothetical protein